MPDKKETKNKKAGKNIFDVAEFGKRVTMVREQVLGLTQTQFAPLLKTKQGLLSRLEAGIGGNIHTAFEIVNYLNQNGLQGHLLFRDIFDIDLFKTEINEPSIKIDVLSKIEAVGKTVLGSYDQIMEIKKLMI